MRPIAEIEDLRLLARRRMPRMFFEYVDTGSWSAGTYRANQADFATIKFRQRVVNDLRGSSLESTMVGQPVSMPVACSPTGLAGMVHADGEMLVAQAAEAAGVPFTLSTVSICSMEDVASVRNTPFWMQTYLMRDRDFVLDLIERARAIKCSALVMSLDLQQLSQRHNDVRNGMSAPPNFTLRNVVDWALHPRWALGMLGTKRRSFGNIIGHAKGVVDLQTLAEWSLDQYDPLLTWDDVAWMKRHWGGKLILKGILDPEDARRAADTGADAIIVSNHGGRQMDGAPSSISMLASIVDAVGDGIEVHFDGGIRSGQDVLKALCLGARGAYIGRSAVFGLGAMGQAGVAAALNIIRSELAATLAFCGERRVAEAGRHMLQPMQYRPADWTGA